MPKHQNLTYSRLPEVLRKLADVIQEDIPLWEDTLNMEEEMTDFVVDIDDALDYLASNDFFGTEGQLDPRGDQRDN